MRRLSKLILLFWFFVAVGVPYFPIPSPSHHDLAGELAGPSLKHPLGQGENGVDLLSHLLWSSRVALGISLASVGLSLLVGWYIGSVLGWFGGKIDLWAMRLLEVWDALPAILVLFVAAMLLEPGAQSLVLALSLASWPFYARYIRSEVARIKPELYIESARSLGMGFLRLQIFHVLPQMRRPLLGLAAQGLAAALIAESSLGFLGLGLTPGTPSWGALLAQSRDAFGQAWHLVIFPSLALISLVVAFHWLAIEQKDSFDSKLRT